MGKFCSICGKELIEGVKFCDNCGNAVTGTQGTVPPPNYYQQQYQQPYAPYIPPYSPQTNLVRRLSEKVKINAIIWLVVACIQYLLTIIYFIGGLSLAGSRWSDEAATGGVLIVMAIILLFVAIINTVYSSKGFDYSKEILQKPIGIVTKYTSIGGCVGNLIYNLFFGGLIGIIGSIHGFTVRNFVMSNEMQFLQIEQQIARQKW